MRIQLMLIIVFAFLMSCKNDTQKSRGAIVLGDSSTIITETDPQYLADFVAEEIKPQTVNSEVSDTVVTDTASPEVVPQPDNNTPSNSAKTNNERVKAPQPNISGSGLKVEFNEVTVFIPGIETKSFRNQDVKNLNGVSYQLTGGSLQGNKLIVKDGHQITRVQQRYITTVIATKDGKNMELDDLDQTTSWTPIKGNHGVYIISGLKPNELQYKHATSGAIRTAVSRAARSNRLSRNDIREWEALVKNVKSVNQSPVSVVLQSVMWRVEGKDKKGKSFMKDVRLDLPL